MVLSCLTKIQRLVWNMSERRRTQIECLLSTGNKQTSCRNGSKPVKLEREKKEKTDEEREYTDEENTNSSEIACNPTRSTSDTERRNQRKIIFYQERSNKTERSSGSKNQKRQKIHSPDRTTEYKNSKRSKRDTEDANSSAEICHPKSFTSNSKHGNRGKKTIFCVEDEFKEEKCKINEVYGDLFEAPPDHSLAHCVAADMRMGSGIAVNFRKKFGNLGRLLDQNSYIGDVAVLNDGDRFIYNLVTKKFSQWKPNLYDVHSSLLKMRRHCEENGVKNLAMPRIGCGLDRLEWADVKEAIKNAFDGLNITITVHDFNPPVGYGLFSKKYVPRITEWDVSLTCVPHETALVFFASEYGPVTDRDWYLLHDLGVYEQFAKQKKKVGRLVSLSRRWYNQNVFGLVVKRANEDTFSYTNFEDCLVVLFKVLKRQRIYSVAYESFDDNFTMAKVISVIKHVFESSGFNFYICNKRWGKKYY